MKKFLLTMLICAIGLFNAQAKIIFVDAGNTAAPVKNGETWATAYISLQVALDDAASGDEIRVATGTYYPEIKFEPDAVGTYGDRFKTFKLKSGVSILGGYNATNGNRDYLLYETILSGDLGTPNVNTDNAYQVVMVVSGTTNVVLDGFTISDGYATGGNNARTVNGDAHQPFYGGGIFLTKATGTFRNLKIINNGTSTGSSANFGGGFYCNAVSGLVTIYNVQFINNKTGSSGNANNYGGAMFAAGTVKLDRVLFMNNSNSGGISSTLGGGAFYMVNTGTSTVTISNAIFYNNNSANGGAIHVPATANTLTIINSTFYKNAGTTAGAIFTTNTAAITLNLYNSLSFGNTATAAGSEDINTQANPTVNLENCLTQTRTSPNNVVTGTNASDVFVSLEDDNSDFLKLKYENGNPALNSGNNTLVPVEVTEDYTGNERKIGVVDMGAYERQETYLPVTLTSFTAKAINQGIRLNWSTASEENNSHFQVWRKTGNNTSFETIGDKVKGAGNSSTTQQYQFVDAKPVAGANYYKLQQVDNNGTSSYGNEVIAYASLANAGTVINYANGQLNLVFEAKDGGSASIAVLDVNGRKVLANSVAVVAGTNQTSTTLGLNKGVYVVKLVLEGSTATQKIVVW